MGLLLTKWGLQLTLSAHFLPLIAYCKHQRHFLFNIQKTITVLCSSMDWQAKKLTSSPRASACLRTFATLCLPWNPSLPLIYQLARTALVSYTMPFHLLIPVYIQYSLKRWLLQKAFSMLLCVLLTFLSCSVLASSPR